jgi:hypothetical protein
MFGGSGETTTSAVSDCNNPGVRLQYLFGGEAQYLVIKAIFPEGFVNKKYVDPAQKDIVIRRQCTWWFRVVFLHFRVFRASYVIDLYK